MKKEFILALKSKFPQAKILGDEDNSLPNTVYFALPGINSKETLTALKEKVAMSTGSACSSYSQQPSHVLSAMGIDENTSKSTFRLSFGRFTGKSDLLDSLSLLAEAASI
jgi:cysteine desulfurase